MISGKYTGGYNYNLFAKFRYADVKNPFCKPFVFLQNAWILLYLPLARVLVAKRELICYIKENQIHFFFMETFSRHKSA